MKSHKPSFIAKNRGRRLRCQPSICWAERSKSTSATIVASGKPSASVGGKQRQFSTKQEARETAAKAAEDWYLTLHGKLRAGVLDSGPTFRKAADQFLKEYGVITEGERSEKWAESHAIRLRLHLIPFFGDLALNKVTPGKVQEYRVHRMTSYAEPNPHSKSQHKPKNQAAGAQHPSR